MTDFVTALGLVLVIEGIAWATVTPTMRRMLHEMLTLPEPRLRLIGLGAAALGVVVVALARA